MHWKNLGTMCTSKFFGRMGFRDTRNFKLAMLAKHGWRLQLKELTLAYKVLKVRHFPRGEFVNVKIGSNPSYMWRSLKAIQLDGNQERVNLASG